MENNFSQSYGPPIVGGVVQVTGELLGRSLIDHLRNRFSPRCQEQRGDFYMDKSRDLLSKHLKIIPSNNKKLINEEYDRFV